MMINQKLILLSSKEPNMTTIQVSIGDKNYFLYSKYNPKRHSRVFAEETYDKVSWDYLSVTRGRGC